MPATKKQMRAAGRELRLRRAGEVKQEPNRAAATRPFGSTSEANLEAYASWPNPDEQRQAAQGEMDARNRGGVGKSGFSKASLSTVRFYANATDDEIRRRNRAQTGR